MFSVQRLRLLVELAERGTIRAVADALHFSPSTVSQGLSSLEAEVGAALLERGPRSVRLTPAGEALAAQGRDILVRLRAASEQARTSGGQGPTPLTVATFPSAGPDVAACTAALRAADGIELHLVEAEPPEALRRLRAAEADLALVYEYGWAEPSRPVGLRFSVLRDEPIVACLPPDFPPVQAAGVDLAELEGRHFAAGRRGSACHAFTTAACRHAGFEPDIRYETDDIGLTGALVRDGLAVALTACSLLDLAPFPVRSAHVRGLPSRRVLLAGRADGPPDVTVQQATDALRRAIA